MDEVLAVALQGMQAGMARADQVAMNLANALTPGYRRAVAVQNPVGQAFAAHLTGAALAPAATLTPGGDAPRVRLLGDSRSGTLKATGQPLDLALAGGGWFEVSTPEGPAYTRLGAFRLDAAGRLVTAQGLAVMGLGGEITLPPGQPLSVTPAGAVLGPDGREDTPLARLKIVEFEDGASPRALGGGLFALDAGGAVRLLAPGALQVRQGFLENANVSSVQEMTQLVQAVRQVESMQRIAQGYDDMLGTAIRKLGETS